jgi:glycerol-3-phosphate dehydrogenase (NAD(P)+)
MNKPEMSDSHLTFGILGSGSWGTALAKILTDNGHVLHWWNRSAEAILQFEQRQHNPQYLSSARFDMSRLRLTTKAEEVIRESDVVIIAIPSAYAIDVLEKLPLDALAGKKVLSAIKGILPQQNVLLNDYLLQRFRFELSDYFAVLGPCHAEEVAAEKLSYLTFSGVDETMAARIATHFRTPYMHTVCNKDIFGVQYAAVLKNIYAVGAGMAHGLDYGDNFLSVLIANSADEMAGFLRKAGIINAEVGYLEQEKKPDEAHVHHNYAASVYLGDLLVTCYSLYSRNRTFGNMIGKGYAVKAAQLEMSMVAEGYNASRCMYSINQQIGARMPIAENIFRVLWENLPAQEAFLDIEKHLI